MYDPTESGLTSFRMQFQKRHLCIYYLKISNPIMCGSLSKTGCIDKLFMKQRNRCYAGLELTGQFP